MTAERIPVAAARKPDAIGKHALVQGWIRTRRDPKGGFSFLDVIPFPRTPGNAEF